MDFPLSRGANFVGKIVLVGLLASLLLRCDAQLLPEEEVQVLQTISSKLGNTYWNYLNQSSCNGGFNQTFLRNIYSGIVCNCSYNSSTVCHVTHMYARIKF
ncbi:probable LRR receptor-like serine/threonine-protein kinase At1g53430 [Salvia hispanica]|uniref:probable LRR receptor-like serine/threonine-protein kinase At1g53430 n=1 Tax=Salvia hispanica TaxID=49212 RepID=UPI002009B161|nr:probable LRR receptor-like serine/threonine-protein kinase At1g53430 [Salvia hispanica]